MDLAAMSQLVMIDFISVPMVSNGDEIKKIRELLGPHGRSIKVMAKIDSMDSIEKCEEIMAETDGLIVVRNELQWEVSPEKLMIAQRYLIEQANVAAKPVMIQSQLLESMVSNHMPSRQELADISLATTQGADCFILSHESSIGANPGAAAICLSKAIAEAENIFDYEQ